MTPTFDPHKNTTEVRQGDRHKTNLRALIIALIAVVILFAAVFIFYQMQPGTIPPA